MEHLRRIRRLRLYIPFIDYAVSIDEEKYAKLDSMKQWILEKKIFPVEVLEKFEQSIHVQYKNLLLERSTDVKIPKNIMDIFNESALVRFETIDLCSDDELTEMVNVAPKPTSSSKAVEKKGEGSSKNILDISDGEIVDSDTDTISKVVKKPISFQISAEQNKTNVNVDNRDATKQVESVNIASEKKKSRKKKKKHSKSSSESNTRKVIKEVQPEEKKASISEKEVELDKEDEETEALLKRIDQLDVITENKTNESIECMSISDNSIDETVFELLKNKVKPSEATKNENKDEKPEHSKKHRTFSSEMNIQEEIKKALSEERKNSTSEKQSALDKEDEDTAALLKRIDKLCNITENKNNESIEYMSISDNSIDENVFELLKNKKQPTEATKNKKKKEKIEKVEHIEKEEQIFTRRSYKVESSPVTLDDYDLKTKIKKLRKKRLSNADKTKSEMLDDLSSDEDPFPIAVVPKPSPHKIKQKTEAVTCITLSDTDELANEKEANDKNGDGKAASSQKWEKMDINELSSILTKLTKSSNIDIEHFLAAIAKTDNDMSTSPTTSPYYAADNNNMNAPYVINEYKNVEYLNSNAATEPKDNFYSSSHVNEFQPQFPQMPQFPMMQQAPPPPPPIQQPPAPNSYPIFHINGRKINLNDPRVRQHLLSFQKSTEPGSATPTETPTPTPTNSRGIAQPNQCIQNGCRSGPSRPLTYGEYRRRKAEEAEELARRKQAEIQAMLMQTNSEKINKVGTSNIEQPAPQNNNINTKDPAPTPKTVEAIRYNEPKKTKPVATKKATKTKKLEKQTQPNNNRKSPPLQTVETPSSAPNATNIPSADKSLSTMRALKSLECTVIGFDHIEKNWYCKRKSSETAREAIAKQLSGQQQQQQSESTTTEAGNSNKRSRISMRRSSMCNASGKNNIFEDSPAPIAKRRKTCAEVSLASLLQDSSTDSAEESDNVGENLTAPRRSLRIVSSSSSDTDTFDFHEFNYKKLKAIAAVNQPFVRLQRLTDDEINKHLRRNRPVPPEQMCLDVKLVERTTQKAAEYSCPKPAAAAVPKTKTCKNVSNIDVRMTERNTTYCALCKAKPVNLVNHYIRTHKTEPYVARLTSKELEDLQLNCPFAVPHGPSNARIPKYKVQCLFCADELIDSFINFYMHYSAHTGEYAFQCYNCELKKPYRADIQSHKNHAKSCRNAQIQKLYVYPTNLMVIYLHCCKLCNFVQLNEANVFKHLRDQHAKRGDDPIYVQKYIAAAINDAEIVNELLPEEETEFLAREASFENHEETYSGLNCSELDIKLDTDAWYESELENNCTQNLPSAHMTAIPISNLKSSSLQSKNPETNEEEAEIELPRPIIVKVEPKVEHDSYDLEPISNGDTAHQHYRVYPQDISYFGVFKCMATDCFFSTDAEARMLQHLNDHGSSECQPTGWLECSYCKMRHAVSKAEDLIAHIKLKHWHSRFQCSMCCYRSCAPGSVAIHCCSTHNKESDAVFMYECEGESQSEKERLPDMMKSMAEHVGKLQCGHCSLGFYGISSLREHLNKTHGSLTDDPASLPEYSCIYCVMDLARKTDMQEHVALKHPDELAYACKRVLKNPFMDDAIDNIQLWNIAAIVPLTAIRKPMTPAALMQSLCLTPMLQQRENTTNSCSDMCQLGPELNTTDSGTESVAAEVLDEQPDLKPSPEHLIHLAEETVRALLNKLTSKTGLSPDRLYHCPVATCGGFFSSHSLWSRHMSLRHNCLITRCPHCPIHLELPLFDFKEHFEHHCRHLYVCFHCCETFVNEEATITHYQIVHSNELNFRFELIKFNLLHSYRIIMSESTSAERLEFCQLLQDNTSKRLEQLVKEEHSKLISKWLAPASADWLDDYPAPNRKNAKTCIVKPCQYKTKNMVELFEHWEASHEVAGDFKCSRCSVVINNLSSWQPIVEHVRMHDSSYVCSVCNYHNFGRQQMSTHISLEHNSRDVPFVSLFHSSSEHTYVGVGVVFAARCKTFSTTNACFFCNAKNLSVETLSRHFKQEHKVSMQHFCEICSEPFNNLSEVDAHHSSSHAGCPMKIRCEFVSHLQLIVRSTFPLGVDIMSNDLIATKRSNRSSVPNEKIQQNKASCVDRSAENFAAFIKKEIDDDDGNSSDSDIEIIEADDLVREEEFKARRNEQNKKMSEPPRLKVKNLFESNTTSVIEKTQTTAASVPMSITITPISYLSNQSNNLKLPTVLNTTTLQQTPAQVMTPTGSKNYPSNHSLLQQALYNTASISMQSPVQQIEPNNFSPQLNVYPSPQQKQPVVNPQQHVVHQQQHVHQQQQVVHQQRQVVHQQQQVAHQQHRNSTPATQQIQPTKCSPTLNQGSSQHQKQQTQQTVHHPQKEVNHQNNSSNVPKQQRKNKLPTLANQGLAQHQKQQTQQTFNRPPAAIRPIRPKESTVISFQDSFKQEIQQNQQTIHAPGQTTNQHRNAGSVHHAQQQLPQTQHNNVSVTKTTVQTNYTPMQHSSSLPQQIQPNPQQQTRYNAISILKKTPQSTYTQQPVIGNQHQDLGPLAKQIRPIGQVQPMQQTGCNPSTAQTKPQSISVRLSAPVGTNQIIMNPTVPHLVPQTNFVHMQPSTAQFLPVMQSWVPPSSLNISYAATTNSTNTHQTNYNTQLKQTLPQSLNSSPHNYFH